MAKYTKDELRQMARQHLQARNAGDFRSIQVEIQVGVRTGLHPNQVLHHIKELAR